MKKFKPTMNSFEIIFLLSFYFTLTVTFYINLFISLFSLTKTIFSTIKVKLDRHIINMSQD